MNPHPFTDWSAVDRYVAQHAPVLASVYSTAPDHLANALDHVATYLPRYPALVLAMQARNTAEIGRLLLDAMDEHIAHRADDDASDAYYEQEGAL